MTTLLLKTLGALLITALLTAYVRGWRRLRWLGHRPPAWRLAAYTLGMATMAVALLALDELADERFWVHMIQHLLLIMLAAPFVELGDPLALVLWGLPRGARAKNIACSRACSSSCSAAAS